MDVLTVKDLLNICKEQIAKGNGDKKIMISQDDEGNGYHYLFYGMTAGEEMKEDDMFMMSVDEDYVPIEDTIVLG